MEEKRVFSNQRFYSNDCFIYSLNGFDKFPVLDEPHTRVALRILKEHFDRFIGFKTTDALFEDIFDAVPSLRPLHPIGFGHSMLGYIRPLQFVLKKHGVSESYYKEILAFFGAPRRH